MCALFANLYNVHQSIQTVESSAREFLGKDKSTTLMASVVSRHHSLISLTMFSNTVSTMYSSHAELY
jgi:hypothetical protein